MNTYQRILTRTRVSCAITATALSTRYNFHERYLHHRNSKCKIGRRRYPAARPQAEWLQSATAQTVKNRGSLRDRRECSMAESYTSRAGHTVCHPQPAVIVRICGNARFTAPNSLIIPAPTFPHAGLSPHVICSSVTEAGSQILHRLFNHIEQCAHV
jgi:hypothetical protein